MTKPVQLGIDVNVIVKPIVRVKNRKKGKEYEYGLVSVAFPREWIGKRVYILTEDEFRKIEKKIDELKEWIAYLQNVLALIVSLMMEGAKNLGIQDLVLKILDKTLRYIEERESTEIRKAQEQSQENNRTTT